MALERVGIDPEAAYYTNAMLCQPPADTGPQAKGGARGTGGAKTSGYRAGIEACRERLATEVLSYPRTLILTLGNSANRGLLGDFSFKITGKRGHAIDLGDIGVVFPTFHPASILRNQGEWPRWFEDLKYAAKVLEGGSESIKHPEKTHAYILLADPNEATTYPILRLPPKAGTKKVKDGDENAVRTWDSDLVDPEALATPDWADTTIITGIPAAVRAIDSLTSMPILSADIETGYSYSPREGKVIALSIAWSATEALVISEGLLDSKAFRPYLLKLLTAPGPLWVGHNFKYDASFLRWQLLGGEWPKEGFVNGHDTLLEHYCLDETKGVHALESVARDLLGAADYKYIVRKYGLHDKGYENVPREILYPYAALDTTHTFSIHEILCKKVHADKGLAKLYDKLLLPASRFLETVQDYGLHVHQDFIAVLDENLGGKVAQAEADLVKEVNAKVMCKIHKKMEVLWDTDEYMASKKWATKKRPDGYLARNWRHNSFILEKLIGWVPMNTNERTLRDLDQTGKDQSATFGYKAKNYARGHPNRKIKLNYPFIQALIDYRLSTHAYNMLVKGVVGTMERDGRLHSYFNLHATETGRLSSTNPNLQNLPVPEKDDPAPARNIVGAPEGRVLVEADYKQLELKLLAHFSDDKNLLDVYLNGRDLHTELSIAIWGDREFDTNGVQTGGYTNYQRVRAKAVNFGIAYGRGAGSIAAEHDILESEAEEMRQAWFAQFPAAARWLNYLHQAPFSGKGRTIITLFGRRRRFGVISAENHSDLKNQSANFPMQSTGSDLTLLSAMKIQQKWDREGTDAHIVCLVHDALVAECPEEISDQVAAELAAVMEDIPNRVLQPKIKFDTDVHVGRAWGTLKTEEMKDTKKATGVGAGSLFGQAVSKESQKRAARLT